MKPTKSGHSRRAVLQSMFAAPLVLHAPGAWGKSDYPDRPIRLVMTLPAGTSADVMARFIAEKLQAELGQAVWVDNRPGASSNIGYQAASTAPADGYTLLYGLLSVILNQYLFKTLPYKPSDFTPIIHLLDVPFVLVVRARLALSHGARTAACRQGGPGQAHILLLRPRLRQSCGHAPNASVHRGKNDPRPVQGWWLERSAGRTHRLLAGRDGHDHPSYCLGRLAPAGRIYASTA